MVRKTPNIHIYEDDTIKSSVNQLIDSSTNHFSSTTNSFSTTGHTNKDRKACFHIKYNNSDDYSTQPRV